MPALGVLLWRSFPTFSICGTTRLTPAGAHRGLVETRAHPDGPRCPPVRDNPGGPATRRSDSRRQAPLPLGSRVSASSLPDGTSREYSTPCRTVALRVGL